MSNLTAEKIIKDFCQDVFYVVFNKMLFVCIRGVLIRDNKFLFNDNKLDEWNDTIWVFDKNYSKPYDATIDPGAIYVKNPITPSGAARILPGITTLAIGKHRGRDAFVQIGNVFVYRDFNRNGEWEEKAISTATGINLHPANNLNNVGRDSAGCTVPKVTWDSVEWLHDFIGRGKASGQRKFFRIVIEQEELAKYIGSKYSSSNNLINLDDILYKNRNKLNG